MLKRLVSALKPSPGAWEAAAHAARAGKTPIGTGALQSADAGLAAEAAGLLEASRLMPAFEVLV